MFLFQREKKGGIKNETLHAFGFTSRLSVATSPSARRRDRCTFQQLKQGRIKPLVAPLHMHSLWELRPFEMQGQRQD